MNTANTTTDFPFMQVFGVPEICIERGTGTHVWDTTGKRYLDFLSGIAVVSLGHCNPAVTAAVTEQAAKLWHVSNFFTNPVALHAAAKINTLLRSATGEDGKIFFTNSGAESNECALKLARKWAGPGRHTIISTLGSFHGRTMATLAATGQPAKHAPFAPMPAGYVHAPWGNLDAIADKIDLTTAAILIEPIQGEGGVMPAPEGYLAGLRQLCDDHGILLIVDEIQTGFARTGQWFGFQHSQVKPDIVTLAKGIGNGMPIGACWARSDVAATFAPGDHGSTYSGTALATAAVSAVIDEMTRIDAPQLAHNTGCRFREQLTALDAVTDVRGAGLLLGAQLVEGVDATAVYTDLLDAGLICNAVNTSTLRFAPPITVSETEVDEAVILIDRVLAQHRVGS